MTIQKPPSQPRCTWVEECIEMCTSRSVFVEERGIRATFRNPSGKQIRKIYYDGCYYSAATGRHADFIVGLLDRIDILVELKGSDTNLTGRSGAFDQIESTLQVWKTDEHCGPRVAALIVYGRNMVKKKLPGRVPRALAERSALEAQFLKAHKILLLIRENGERQFSFNDFLRKNDAR
jgi:hypothetical protein